MCWRASHYAHDGEVDSNWIEAGLREQQDLLASLRRRLCSWSISSAVDNYSKHARAIPRRSSRAPDARRLGIIIDHPLGTIALCKCLLACHR